MPELDLEPEHYRDHTKPRAIPRKEAAGLLVYCVGIALFMQWIVLPNYYVAGLLLWAPLILVGALITRLWPLAIMGND